jgi:environmental stress-induced protein Ves
MKIISKANQSISNWSGGTTTELFIFPPETEYAKRDFLFRISTANVEAETSTFTPLPDYTRILMILKGELTLTHEEQYSKHLVPFKTDIFNGAWKTSAVGKVTDFNIMFAENMDAQLTALNVHPEIPLSFSPTKTFCFGYLISGNVSIKNASTQKEIVTGDFVLLNKDEHYTLIAQHDCDWLFMEIEYQMYSRH